MGSSHIVGVSSLAGRVWTPYRWEVAILWVCHHWLGGCGHRTDGKWPYCGCVITGWKGVDTVQMGSGHIVGVSSLAGKVWTLYRWEVAGDCSSYDLLYESALPSHASRYARKGRWPYCGRVFTFW